jgi:opacity protein-like surface antigen
MNFRSLFAVPLVSAALATAVFAGSDKEISSAAPEITSEPYEFSAEFDLEGAYIGGADVRRSGREVNDLDEIYSNVRFVYTPRIKFGILRLGAQWERYSFGFSGGGQQLPNTLQAVNSIVGFDTQFSDSILVRLETQPGFYGTSFDHLNGDDFNIPFVLGGTYILNPDLQFVFGLSVNVQQKYPVLPGGGIRWKFARKWVLNAVLPTPRLEYELNRSVKLFAGADIKANTFRVDHHFGDSHDDSGLNNAWVSYSEIRAGAGMEWKLSSSLTLALEGGYLPYRDFDFHRTDVRYHSESGAPYGSVVLHGAF